jgi:hypothetical protein
MNFLNINHHLGNLPSLSNGTKNLNNNETWHMSLIIYKFYRERRE